MFQFFFVKTSESFHKFWLKLWWWLCTLKYCLFRHNFMIWTEWLRLDICRAIQHKQLWQTRTNYLSYIHSLPATLFLSWESFYEMWNKAGSYKWIIDDTLTPSNELRLQIFLSISLERILIFRLFFKIFPLTDRLHTSNYLSLCLNIEPILSVKSLVK